MFRFCLGKYILTKEDLMHYIIILYIIKCLGHNIFAWMNHNHLTYPLLKVWITVQLKYPVFNICQFIVFTINTNVINDCNNTQHILVISVSGLLHKGINIFLICLCCLSNILVHIHLFYLPFWNGQSWIKQFSVMVKLWCVIVSIWFTYVCKLVITLLSNYILFHYIKEEN